MILCDTNILITYLSGEKGVIEKLSAEVLSGNMIFVSSLSRAELLAYSQLTEVQIKNIQESLERFLSIPFDDRLANEAGYIRREYGLKFQDAGIAATASVFRIPLLTRDKQMKKVKEIVVVGV